MLSPKTNVTNLFIIGAAKCATSTVNEVLSQHTDIFMNKRNAMGTNGTEASYFCDDNYKERLHWYYSLYEAAPESKYYGDCSPIYSTVSIFPEMPKRIYEFNPEAKVIYIVRNPIERLKSVWAHTLSHGHWYKDVFQSRFKYQRKLIMPLDFESDLFEYPSFIEDTRYWKTIEAYQKHFSEDQFLLLFYEDIKNDPEKFYNQIFTFLNLKSLDDPDLINLKMNESKKKRMFRPLYFRIPEKLQKIFKGLTPPALFYYSITKYVCKPKIDSDLMNKIYVALEEDIHKTLEYCGKSHVFCGY
jgi:hypothetical protein